MRVLPGLLFVLAGCTVEGGGARYTDRCKEGAPGAEVADTTGTFRVEGPSDVPEPFIVGTYTGATGSLNVLTCVPTAADAVLDSLTFDLELVLFDLDDQAIDLPVGDSTTTNVLWGTVTDWDDLVAWDGGATFTSLTGGTASFSEVDKDGRLVGTIDVTDTDPAGTPMTITLDLSW